MDGATADEVRLCQDVRTMCACNRLRRTTRTVTQIYDAAMAPSGLKVTQIPILVALRLAGELPLTSLAELVGLDRTTLTRNLAVLEGRELVRTVPREDDGRIRVLALTPDGRRVLAGALERWAQVQSAVRDNFGEERLRALYAELDELAGVVG